MPRTIKRMCLCRYEEKIALHEEYVSSNKRRHARVVADSCAAIDHGLQPRFHAVPVPGAPLSANGRSTPLDRVDS